MADDSNSPQHFIVQHDGKLHLMTSLGSVDPSNANASADEQASAAWMASQLGSATSKQVDTDAAARPTTFIVMLAKPAG